MTVIMLLWEEIWAWNTFEQNNNYKKKICNFRRPFHNNILYIHTRQTSINKFTSLSTQNDPLFLVSVPNSVALAPLVKSTENAHSHSHSQCSKNLKKSRLLWVFRCAPRCHFGVEKRRLIIKGKQLKSFRDLSHRRATPAREIQHIHVPVALDYLRARSGLAFPSLRNLGTTVE